jgi:hypothetical protein
VLCVFILIKGPLIFFYIFWKCAVRRHSTVKVLKLNPLS